MTLRPWTLLLLGFLILPLSSAHAQTAEVDIETFFGGAVTGRYVNLPADSELILMDFYGNRQVPGSPVRKIKKGGSGEFTFTIEPSWNGGAGSMYWVKAVPKGNTSMTLARSENFQGWAKLHTQPTCSISASSYHVGRGEQFTLSWKGKKASWARYDGKDVPIRSSERLVETTPGWYQYTVTFQGERYQEICFAYVRVSNEVVQSTETGKKARPSGSFSNSSLTAYDQQPLISGVARGVSTVGFSIDNGDKVYGSGTIPVVNGQWQHRVSTSLPNGTYKITLSYYDESRHKNVKLAKETLAVRVYSKAKEVANSPVIIGVHDSPTGTVTVRLKGNARTLPQPLVLSAYESVTWIIENPDNLPITNIIVTGPEEQTVEVTPNKGVRYFFKSTGAGEYSYAYQTGKQQEALLAWLRKMFGYTNSGNFVGEKSTDYVEVYMGIKG